MTDCDCLIGLPFSTGGDAHHGAIRCIADRFQITPERGGNAAIIRIFHDRFTFAVFDQPADFAAELKLVAAVVDRPGTVGIHQYAALDGSDHLLQRDLVGLQIDVRHAIDGRPVPAAASAVCDAVQTGASLRRHTTQWSLQDTIFDQILVGGNSTFIVIAVAGDLIGLGRIERDIEQIGAIAIAAEHLRRDETGSGIVAFVSKNAVQLQGMADAFMDLQHHLVRHQQQVAYAGRTIGRI